MTFNVSGAKAVFGSEFDLSEPDPLRELNGPKQNAVVYGLFLTSTQSRSAAAGKL